MPYTIAHDAKLDALVVTTQGDLTAEAFHAMIEETRQRCAQRALPRVLVDHSASTVRHISAAQISAIADLCTCLNEVLRDGRLAVVLAGEVDYGLGRMWETYAEGQLSYRSRLFRERGAAVLWLAETLARGAGPTTGAAGG